ncbi:hypothetical protein E2C01_033296 [Portunus trituberculatus]|uniref:Uncharacterized protein n=1 Tax=Portunus trituberculatus TaxID=210409 RepID=A0A5B7F3D7_PORTR|nr:hypothetical protein [Portunus trituberculatus]
MITARAGGRAEGEREMREGESPSLPLCLPPSLRPSIATPHQVFPSFPQEAFRPVSLAYSGKHATHQPGCQIINNKSYLSYPSGRPAYQSWAVSGGPAQCRPHGDAATRREHTNKHTGRHDERLDDDWIPLFVVSDATQGQRPRQQFSVSFTICCWLSPVLHPLPGTPSITCQAQDISQAVSSSIISFSPDSVTLVSSVYGR